MFQVTSDIPPPPYRGRRIYPFTELKVGDSFVHQGTRNAVTRLMAYNAARTGHRYTSRREGAGYRIWRIA